MQGEIRPPRFAASGRLPLQGCGTLKTPSFCIQTMQAKTPSGLCVSMSLSSHLLHRRRIPPSLPRVQEVMTTLLLALLLQAKPYPERPDPDIADFKYGTQSERQVLDLWKARSEGPAPLVVLIHGGGWKQGDKRGYGTTAIRPFLDAGISVAAINYRFIEQAMEQKVEPPVKACLHDAARAIQSLRAKAAEWNLDPARVAATGGSAGACTSLWLALHDDLADPSSPDPVARQSTRLLGAAVSGAQTSLDPVQLRTWISNSIYGGHAFGFAAKDRSRAQEFDLLLENREKVLPWIREYSPIELLSKDDPPLYLDYPNQKTAPVAGGKEPDPTHSALYGIRFAERAKELGVSCTVAYPAGAKDEVHGSPTRWLIAALKPR
jgi:acetyl esterase/lipase